MKRALIITYNKFPEGDAGAVRQYVFSKLLIELGYETTVIGMGNSDLMKMSTYAGVEYTSFRNANMKLCSKLDNYFGYGKKLKSFLVKSKKYDLLLVVDLPLNAMNIAVAYAKKNNIPIIHDSVEWYSPEQFKRGIFSLEYIRKNYKNKYYFKKPWNIIAISHYLEEHFSEKKMQTTCIPAILDVANTSCKKIYNDEKVVILYAGALGSKNSGVKDYIEEFLQALLLLKDEERRKIEFRLLGSNQQQLEELIDFSVDEWECLYECVKCFGRVPRKVVQDNLSEANFTILFRNTELRYAKAGFSTKIVESLASGTPVICNLTSDMGLYLSNGYNAFIVENLNCNSIADVLHDILKLDEVEQKKLCDNARNTAEKKFDYRVYIEQVRNFLGEIING